MPAGAVFGLVACYLISFALVGAAFFTWWAIKSELKAIPDVAHALQPLQHRIELLQAEVKRLGEVPATLKKRIDEAEEASQLATKRIDSFTGQLGRMKRTMQDREGLGDGEGIPDGQQFIFPEADPTASTPQTRQRSKNFGVTARKVG